MEGGMSEPPYILTPLQLPSELTMTHVTLLTPTMQEVIAIYSF